MARGRRFRPIELALVAVMAMCALVAIVMLVLYATSSSTSSPAAPPTTRVTSTSNDIFSFTPATAPALSSSSWSPDPAAEIAVMVLALLPIALWGGERALRRRCPHCWEHAHRRATRCPHCHSELAAVTIKEAWTRET